MFNNIHFSNIGTVTYICKLFFITICTYYTNSRILNTKNFLNYKLVLIAIPTIIADILTVSIRNTTTIFYSAIFLIIVLSILYSIISKNKIGNSVLTTTISVTINHILFSLASILIFLPILITKISNDYVQLSMICCIHILLLHSIFKIKRFKNGLSFIQHNAENEYFDMLILIISVSILFTIIMLPSLSNEFTKSLLYMLAIFSIIMIITIQKTLTMYYKHKLLVSELEDTKKELENKNKEISELEKENLNFSKVSHSIAHKQRALEYKLNQLSTKSEIAEELDVSNKIKEISKEYSAIDSSVELSKTEIEVIDNMLEFLQAECIENKIEFDLILSGNIHHMINKFVDEDKLEILLADHIKNAIIAINNSENINRSILVKLGMVNRHYSLVVFDSGIEFEIDTLMNLGLKPSSTHLDDGGTGMGFMNTFDTLDKTNASMYINEIGKPSKDNYTKSISIIFDDKHEYKISSYRSDKIKEKNIRENLIIK